MSIPITCSCGQALSAPDDTAGGVFYCWSCGRPVPVPSPAQPASAPGAPGSSGGFSAAPTFIRSRQEDTPASLRRFTFPAAEWEQVRSGLAMVNIGAGLFLLLMLIAWVMILDNKAPTSPQGAKSLALLLTFLLGGGVVLGALGAIRCSSVPAESGAKGPVTFAGLFMAAGAIGTVILCLISLTAIMSSEGAAVGPGFAKFLLKLMLIGLQGGFLLFMFFQLITALHLGERGLASSVIGFQLTPLLFAAINPYAGSALIPLAALEGGMERGSSADPKLWMNLWMFMLIGMLVWFIWINVTLRSSIEAAERRQNGL